MLGHVWIRSSLLVLASLWMAKAPIPHFLKAYAYTNAGFSLSVITVRTMGLDIQSHVYGFLWLLFNLGLVGYGTAYAWSILREHRWLMAAELMIALFIFGHASADSWWMWLVIGNGVLFSMLGASLLVAYRDAISILCGAWWFIGATSQYAFARLIHTHPVLWQVNNYFPAILSLTFMVAIGWRGRHEYRNKEALAGF